MFVDLTACVFSEGGFFHDSGLVNQGSWSRTLDVLYDVLYKPLHSQSVSVQEYFSASYEEKLEMVNTRIRL